MTGDRQSRDWPRKALKIEMSLKFSEIEKQGAQTWKIIGKW